MGIRSVRLSKKLTQQALADALGTQRSTVAMWETGQSKPRADTLIKLAAIFGCTVDELLANEPPRGAEGRRERKWQTTV